LSIASATRSKGADMFKHIVKSAIAVVFGLTLAGIANCQVLNAWFVGEIYSNADGSVQFILLEFDIFCGVCVSPPPLAGQTLMVTNGSTDRSFTIPYDASCDENGCFFLVGTQGFADLNLARTNFVVPNGFVFTTNGTIKLGASAISYDALPTDGAHALYPHGIFFGDDAPRVGATVSGISGFLTYFPLPAGINAVIEYYNRGLDDYFLTAYRSEVGVLDLGWIPGWERTGYILAAWTQTSSVAMGENPPPNLAPVCRLWLGDSHFFSISADECAGVEKLPGVYRETNAAFFATLPDSATGSCPAGQTRVFRLWDPRGSVHRYATETAIRDEMLARGYLAEGYGPDPVAMCVGGAAR